MNTDTAVKSLTQVQEEAEEKTIIPYSKPYYTFPILEGKGALREKEVEDLLVNNICETLAEMGECFAFVGRQMRLSNDPAFLDRADLVFYNYALHRFFIVELKVSNFNSRDSGQINRYINLADCYLRKEGDNKTCGILLCAQVNKEEAQLCLQTIKSRLFISAYNIQKSAALTLTKAVEVADPTEETFGVYHISNLAPEIAEVLSPEWCAGVSRLLFADSGSTA
ncbi:MAG: DUF1016 domain-containing protein [Oscillospiraceae bacterium]|jgi:predicted nuclease of restriction endonuclease-like (RecB) superfamily|nr:DUF1016 domain-containing protein [Oscillospiraceae bacterium]